MHAPLISCADSILAKVAKTALTNLSIKELELKVQSRRKNSG